MAACEPSAGLPRMDGAAYDWAAGVVAAPAPAAVAIETPAHADLRAQWHPPLAATKEALLLLAAELDEAMVRAAGGGDGGAAAVDAAMAYRVDLVHAVTALSSKRLYVEQAVQPSTGPFFECLFDPSAGPQADGDLLGPDVRHAAAAVALVRKVTFDDPWGNRAVELLSQTVRGSLYRRWRAVPATVSPAILLVHKDSRTLIVACRSTQSRQDYLLDLRVLLKAPPPALNFLPGPLPAATAGPRQDRAGAVRVHEGFGRAAAAIKADVFAGIAAWRRQSPDNTRVVFTGHSLGAAVATLLAAAYGGTGPAAAALVTFGGPRVGTAAAEALIATRTVHTRVVTTGDPVPALPPGASYASAAAAQHWRLDAMAPGVFDHCQDRERHLGCLAVPFINLYRCLVDHPFPSYLKLLTAHYRRLTAAAAAEGPPPLGHAA